MAWYRLAGVTVPDDRRLSLVGDSDRGDVLRRRADSFMADSATPS